MPNRRHSGIAMKHLEPLVAQQITDMRAKEADSTYPWEEPVCISELIFNVIYILWSSFRTIL
jgi:hypothetical protein